jgi:hypothetical protein
MLLLAVTFDGPPPQSVCGDMSQIFERIRFQTEAAVCDCLDECQCASLPPCSILSFHEGSIMKNLVRIGIAGIALAFAGGALAQGKSGQAEFGTVDQNRDGKVSKSEAQAYSELNSQFATLDADRDTYLSQAEFGKWKPAPAPIAPAPAPGAASDAGKAPMGGDPATRSPAPQSTGDSSQPAGEAK